MGRWFESGRTMRAHLAAGGLAGVLLVAGCGEDSAQQQAQEKTADTTEMAEVASQPVDPAQAPVIQKAIDDYLLLMEGPEAQRVMHHGAVKVSADGEAFAVAIEGVRFGVAAGGSLEIGTVTYRLTPRESDGYVVSDLVHAASFPNRDAAGKEIGSLALKTQSFTGEWSSSLETLLALDWQATDIVAREDTPQGGDVRAKGLAVTVTSTDKGGGIFDQKGTVDLAGFSAKEDAGGVIEIGKLAGTFGLGDVRLKEYVTKTRELQTLTAELAEQAASAAQVAEQSPDTEPQVPQPALSPEQAQKMGELIKSMSATMKAVSYDFGLSGLSFKEADGSEPFRLANGRIAFGMDGLDGEKARIKLGLGHDGMVINDPEITAFPLAEKLVPVRGELDVTLSDVPSRELWNILGDQFPALLAGNPDQSEAAFNLMFLTVGQLLQQAPMKLAIGPSGLAGDAMQVGASGAFDVLPDAAFGLVGALDLDVHGLDTAMQLATDAAQTSPEAAQIVGTLAMIQSLAKRETGDDGKPVDRLKIEVDAAGDTRVNGVSLSGM